MKGRILTVVTGLALVGVGFLLGSFWLQWRHASLADGGSPASVRGTPVTLPEGFSSRARVEVLNGMGESGAAEAAASRLRDMGFDVVYFGNASSFDHERTEVLARTRKTDAARRVADSLGVDSLIVRPDTSLYLDATVVLGKDWERVLARAAAGDGGAKDPGPGGGDLLHRILDRIGG